MKKFLIHCLTYTALSIVALSAPAAYASDKDWQIAVVIADPAGNVAIFGSNEHYATEEACKGAKEARVKGIGVELEGKGVIMDSACLQVDALGEKV